MTGLNEFLKMFGNITIAQVVGFVLSCVFLFFIYKKVKQYFDTKIKSKNTRTIDFPNRL